MLRVNATIILLMKKKCYPIGRLAIVISFMVSSLVACKREISSNTFEKSQQISTGTFSVLTTQRPVRIDAENPLELGMKFKSSLPGNVTKFRYYKVVGETGTHTGHLWSAGGSLLKSAIFTSETDTGWQTVTLDTPFPIDSNVVYVVSVNSVSKYGATNDAFTSTITNGPLSSIAGNNGVYIYSPGSFPTQSYQNSNYFRDIEFVPANGDTLAPSAPANLTASNITGNSVTLNWAASTDNAGVTAYDVYRNGVLISTVTTTTASITGLSGGTAYSFYVKAKDAVGNSSAASNTVDVITPNTSSITHGIQLTTSLVGPTGISITSFTTVPGGTFTGTALSGWGNLARTVGAGGETIDGFSFPAGTVVLQGANISSPITVSSGWLVLRGCKGSMLMNHPTGNGGGGAALFCELTFFNTGGRRWGMQPAAGIVYRCYFPHFGLENVYSDNITVTENWITPDPAAAGSDDHIDAIQTWGGQSYLNFSRNHIEFNGPYTQEGAFSGMVAMYSDGDQEGFDGYDHCTVSDNYFILHGYGVALHAPLAVPVTNMVVSGNLWKWSADAEDKDYTNAVYHNTSQTIPNYKLPGMLWKNNKWVDGPWKDYFILPDNRTSVSEY